MFHTPAHKSTTAAQLPPGANLHPVMRDALAPFLIAPRRNLLEQCSDGVISAAASLCGIFDNPVAFHIALREIQPLPRNDFTVGDVAIAYLRHTLAHLERLQRERAAA